MYTPSSYVSAEALAEATNQTASAVLSLAEILKIETALRLDDKHYFTAADAEVLRVAAND
jgi:hypothetical protein